MLLVSRLSFLAFLIPVLAVWQVPLDSGHRLHGEDRTFFENEDLADWSLDDLPDLNGTDNLVFETVHSLLQHWPNTRIRNGHNIIPGIIPKGTNIYHVGKNNKLPQGVDWVATDPEHSRVLCIDFFTGGHICRFMTLAVIRPLKIIYFDGSSAANLPTGTADTQELIAWGRPDSGGYSTELPMMQDLCQWGAKFGVDGIVRMEMDFEIILCDFTSTVSLVSSVDLLGRGLVKIAQPGFITFEVIDAGSWHNHFPGETRVRLDLAGLVSFYDTELVPSLVPIRAGQERWDHRVQNTSHEDILAVKSRLEAILVGPSGPSSGIDWEPLVQVIVDRFAGRLEFTCHLLNSSATNADEMIDLAIHTQSQLRIMLTPYILSSATPSDRDFAMPIYKLCATTHTKFIESQLDSMTDSEKLLLRAVRGTNQEICRVVTKMWAVGVHAGIDSLLNTKESLDVVEVARIWATWAEDLNRLMTWLDWSVWIKCNPSCGPEELCYLATWPLNLEHNMTESEQENWDRPQPKCIRRISPHGFY